MDIEYQVGEETLSFDPYMFDKKQTAIASSQYSGTEKTIACFRTDRVTDEETNSHVLLYYKRFRGATQNAQGVYNSTADNIFEAFTSLTCDGDAVRLDLQASSGSDSWQTPDEFESSVTSKENHITYRFLGPPKYVCRKSTGIHTDHEILDDSTSLEGVKICTNRDNRKDLFVTYNNTIKDRILIMQLEPFDRSDKG